MCPRSWMLRMLEIFNAAANMVLYIKYIESDKSWANVCWNYWKQRNEEKIKNRMVIHGTRIYYGYFMDFFITKLLLLWSHFFAHFNATNGGATNKKSCKKFFSRKFPHFLLISFVPWNILRCQFYHYQVMVWCVLFHTASAIPLKMNNVWFVLAEFFSFCPHATQPYCCHFMASPLSLNWNVNSSNACNTFEQFDFYYTRHGHIFHSNLDKLFYIKSTMNILNYFLWKK